MPTENIQECTYHIDDYDIKSKHQKVLGFPQETYKPGFSWR